MKREHGKLWRRMACAVSMVTVFFAAAGSAIASDYSDAVSADSTTAYWRLGEAAGSTTAADSTGNGATGTYSGVSLATPGAIGSGELDTAATFSGASGTGVMVANQAGLESGTSDFAVEAWVRTTGSGVVVSKASANGSYLNCLNGIPASGVNWPGWALRVLAGGTVRFDVADSGTIDDLGCHHPHQVLANGASTVNDGNWHHIAVVVSRVSGVTVYVDGDAATTVGPTPASLTNGAPVRIGTGLGTVAYSGFVGDIDEVALYGTALTADQIDNHSTLGSGEWTVADDSSTYTNYSNTDVGDELIDPTDGSTYFVDALGEDQFEESLTCCSDPDPRTQIMATTLKPYRRIAWINEAGGNCSGFMIGASTVATTGHCVYEGGQWVSRLSITVIPGSNTDPEAFLHRPYGSCGAARLFTNRAWQKRENPKYDYGAIKLNCSIGDRTGWFGLTTASPVDGVPSIVAGYGVSDVQTKPAGTLWRSVGHVVTSTNRRIYYTNETFPGDSGTPVYRSASSSCHWCVLGIAAYRFQPAQGCGFLGCDSGTRINRWVLRNFNHWRHT